MRIQYPLCPNCDSKNVQKIGEFFICPDCQNVKKSEKFYGDVIVMHFPRCPNPECRHRLYYRTDGSYGSPKRIMCARCSSIEIGEREIHDVKYRTNGGEEVIELHITKEVRDKYWNTKRYIMDRLIEIQKDFVSFGRQLKRIQCMIDENIKEDEEKYEREET